MAETNFFAYARYSSIDSNYRGISYCFAFEVSSAECQTEATTTSTLQLEFRS